MSERIRVVSPVDGRIVAERALADGAAIAALLARARGAQAAWRQVPLAERQAVASRFVEAFEARAPELAREI
ncbi:MAG TPA: aldehyde dehydrogenase family protein, partial [Myxococcota bacterium]|nr:aldehyde dehydrogenase family protein [Myxococcota bacterium]